MGVIEDALRKLHKLKRGPLPEDDPDFSPWDLVITGHYERALQLYDASPRTKHESNPAAERATILLSLGRLTEALDGYHAAKALTPTEGRWGNPGAYDENIAVVQWLLGDFTGAVTTLRDHVAGLKDGTIRFTDAAGGATPGLLLWFAGASQGDDAIVSEAREHLNSTKTHPLHGGWPSPITSLLLDKTSLNGALQEIVQNSPTSTSVSESQWASTVSGSGYASQPFIMPRSAVASATKADVWNGSPDASLSRKTRFGTNGTSRNTNSRKLPKPKDIRRLR